MGTGMNMLMLLTVLAVGQSGSADVSYVNQRNFAIPIVLPADPRFRSEIEQLHLFVSKDEGRSWQKEATAKPTQDSFEFFAQQDGTYWFNISFVDRQKHSHPEDISKVPPPLKLVVDTRKPLLKFTLTERLGDQVTIAWETREEYPDLATLKLEYRLADSSMWLSVPAVSPSANGAKKFSVGQAASAVSVRMTLSDLAGNSGSTQYDFPAEASIAVAPAAPLSAGPVLSGAGAPPPPENPAVNPAWANKPAAGPKAAESFRPSEGPRGLPSNTLASIDERPARVAIASSSAPPMPKPPPPAPPAMAAKEPAVPTPPPKRNVQYTNQCAIDLAYEVSKVGPSGVGQVTLYVTSDDGTTWKAFGDDADLAPPFSVELPGEGLYGFTLVVKSKAGLGRAAPQSGQAPDIRVELDSTPPEAVLYKVEADPRRKDMLFLTWDATDKNPAQTPISLYWSVKPDGGWQPIAEHIPNTGRYAWQMPVDLPFKVYLRLQVRDLAGNLATADTQEPVLVDLTEPEGRITGIATGAPRKPE